MYYKLTPFAEFAFHCDGAPEDGHHLLDVGQTESESFDVVTIPCRDTVEFLKYAFEVFFF